MMYKKCPLIMVLNLNKDRAMRLNIAARTDEKIYQRKILTARILLLSIKHIALSYSKRRGTIEYAHVHAHSYTMSFSVLKLSYKKIFTPVTLGYFVLFN